MNFVSLREYFYKLANRCLLLVLLPLGIFIYIYYQLVSNKIVPVVHDESLVTIILVLLVVLSLVNLATVHIVAIRRLRRFRTEPGLGTKLDRFYEITMFRISACAASSLVMAVGPVLTGSELFAVFFIAILFWVLIQWPTSRKACRDLALKGDEYEMVLFKKDKF